MLNSHLDRFRLVAFWEGVSFLALLLIAMPLKYLLHWPLAVRIVGMAHGVLFIAFIAALALAALERRWGTKQVSVAFVASLIPGGTFWLDRQLARSLKRGRLARRAPERSWPQLEQVQVESEDPT